MYLVLKGIGGFARATVPYALDGDLNLGVQVTKNFFFDIGGAYQWRKTTALAAETDEVSARLEDHQIIGTVGMGVSF